MAHLVAETSFGLSLLNQCQANQSIVFSPLSIAFALAMVHLGAKGNTKQQINDVILNGANDEELVDHYHFLSTSFLNTSNGVQANIANRMFIRDGFAIKKDYLSNIAVKYNAGAENLNFDNGEESAKIVNAFVNKTTNGKISEIVKTDQFRDDVIAFLINALYFKADWKDKFCPSSTRNDSFHTTQSQTREVEFMRASEVHRSYYENDEVQVLSLPYADSKYAFNVFLPKEKFGLSNFLKGLTAAKMLNLLGSLWKSNLSISLPKFKIENKLQLEDMLKAIGIKDVFSGKGDLSGIADDIRVSEVTQKAMVEIDEKGSIAAAVTVFSVRVSADVYNPDPKEFKADHPFLFTITYDNHPLFIGTHY